ncbi:MAG: GNAT family N-acetyltransferase [Bacteroidales bacterium]
MKTNESAGHFIIRDYQPTDYPAVASLWEATDLGGEVRGDNQDVVERSLAMGGRLLVVVLPDGKLLATSWMTFDGRRLHLHHFGVTPSWQRCGVGRVLAMESIRLAKKKGIQLKLEVHKSNEAAIKLYKSLGFKYLGDYDVYIMRSFD